MDFIENQFLSAKPSRRTKGSSKKHYSQSEKLKLLKEFDSLGAPMRMFCKWYGLNIDTLRKWQINFIKSGESGLIDKKGGRIAVELPDSIKDEIINLKLANPGIGAKKIGDWFARNKFLRIGSKRIQAALDNDVRTAGLKNAPPLRHGNSEEEPKHFERSKPGEMYQMDIMTFMLQGLYRIYIIGCIDDFSRFVVSLGVFRRQTTDRCLDVLRGAIERYGMPKEVLTDNGRQFYTWRGKSQFQKFLIKSGIEHFRSRPYHPQTLGKIESLWRNIYQELLSKEPVNSFEEAEEKLKKWIEWYNFKRPHQGIGGLVPADRFFGVDKPMKEVMEKGMGLVKDALIVDPRRIKSPVYLIGKIDGKEIRIIAKEGSIMVEGLDEVVEKSERDGGENGNSGNNNGGREVSQENRLEEKNESSDSSTDEKQKSEANMQGNAGLEGGSEGMETGGNDGDDERA